MVEIGALGSVSGVGVVGCWRRLLVRRRARSGPDGLLPRQSAVLQGRAHNGLPDRNSPRSLPTTADCTPLLRRDFLGAAPVSRARKDHFTHALRGVRITRVACRWEYGIYRCWTRKRT
uniref:Uncharacterized protein n=1 Tax=Plectus sambesii TaxID=2011161 RepID=A0A914WF81_9BILA